MMANGFEQFMANHADVIHVSVDSVLGSTPRDTDAEMFVAKDAFFGTIGGGQLELRAIERARRMIATQERQVSMDMPLGPGIGQCCGGHVTLRLEHLDDKACEHILSDRAAALAARPVVHICGAGHVGRALASFLALLPVRTVLIDSRQDELRLCRAPVERCLTALPEAEIRNAPAGAAFVVMTHDHALDFLLTSEALARGDAAYVGLIGSQTKRTRFERFHAQQSPRIGTSRLVCPIGATGSTDKRPEVIAAFVAAEVMTALTRAKAHSYAYAG
ncbi:xanthine dehydrogenase accessory protein XdhC [Paracoccus sp. Z330]|uniref:Xanthine dehydrogenase accessory protein XdhC n=1 Tax=Paracoccus onchidii TaxID=3017813 RepID=A0ABT4ZF86_9RHOB|nr:xanthine dehydrogenase accessory protein XdhC [Paracoccus onchidii]MDB6177376.1 xanthine dehydrogenase accessory protein XdhC [Paracoccus onchidii]